jgi:Tfp pilus assembly PilM family ATPase
MILAIVHQGEVRFIINHPTGSEMITKTLITNFGLTRENAENYKIQYGMSRENFDGKMYSAILPMANLIINQIKNTLTFFNSKNPEINIGRLMLSGGGGHLIGFPDFLVENLGLETILINTFDGIETNVANNNPMSFAVNMGLLLR